jgi:hypothetical protein
MRKYPRQFKGNKRSNGKQQNSSCWTRQERKRIPFALKSNPISIKILKRLAFHPRLRKAFCAQEEVLWWDGISIRTVNATFCLLAHSWKYDINAYSWHHYTAFRHTTNFQLLPSICEEKANWHVTYCLWSESNPAQSNREYNRVGRQGTLTDSQLTWCLLFVYLSPFVGGKLDLNWIQMGVSSVGAQIFHYIE